MPVNREIKVIKVPLPDSERMPDYPKAFPRMPQLYLELLENKQKIKQDLINKDYVPVDAPPPPQEEKREEPPKKDSKDEKKRSESSESISTISSDSSVRNMSSEPETVSDSRSDSRSDSSTTRSESDELSNRLKKLLGDDSTSSSSKSKSKSAGSKYTPYDKYKATYAPPPQQPPVQHAPTLTELEQKGFYQRDLEFRNITNVTGEYEEEDKKRELMFKFDLLKKSYPTSATMLPEYSIHSNLKEMQKAYEDSVKRLSLDSTVGTYKTYLIGGFSVVEFVFGNFLGFDMQGFTQQQIINMHSYERLLIELGEKSYVPTGSKWPVELRLLGIIVINAGIFIVSKMIMKKTGANLMNMINTMNAPAGGTGAPARPKRRMKGPDVDLNDIPDISEST